MSRTRNEVRWSMCLVLGIAVSVTACSHQEPSVSSDLGSGGPDWRPLVGEWTGGSGQTITISPDLTWEARGYTAAGEGACGFGTNINTRLDGLVGKLRVSDGAWVIPTTSTMGQNWVGDRREYTVTMSAEWTTDYKKLILQITLHARDGDKECSGSSRVELHKF